MQAAQLLVGSVFRNGVSFRASIRWIFISRFNFISGPSESGSRVGWAHHRSFQSTLPISVLGHLDHVYLSTTWCGLPSTKQCKFLLISHKPWIIISTFGVSFAFKAPPPLFLVSRKVSITPAPYEPITVVTFISGTVPVTVWFFLIYAPPVHPTISTPT